MAPATLALAAIIALVLALVLAFAAARNSPVLRTGILPISSARGREPFAPSGARLHPSPYAQGPPAAEHVWSSTAGLARLHPSPSARLSAGALDEIASTDMGAIGANQLSRRSAGNRGPRRGASWAVRPDTRRTALIAALAPKRAGAQHGL